MATTRYHVTRTIDAAPERIWDLLTDASSYTDWNPAIVRLDGTIDLRSKIELVSTVNPDRPAGRDDRPVDTGPDRAVRAVRRRARDGGGMSAPHGSSRSDR